MKDGFANAKSKAINSHKQS